MPLDAITLRALTNELAPALEGARIDKVQQPERDLLLLSLHTSAGNRRLLISAGVGGARLHFTEQRYENPDAPPMFCMLLRKHLTGARILSLRQPDYERMVVFKLSCRDEMGVESEKRLVAELMGRSANVILVDGGGVIIDCLRRADFGENAVRRLLPGMIYRLPPKQNKPCFFELNSDTRRALWEASDRGAPGDKRLMDAFSGLSPLIARELVHRGLEDMPEAMDALCETIAAGEFTPTMVIRDGAAADFSFMSVNQYGGKNVTYPDFSSLLDAFYSERDKKERSRRATAELTKRVRTMRDRQLRKLSQQREELKSTADREEQRRRGELITANLWRIQKGARVLKCEDWFAEGAPEVEIALDPMKTPQQNAAAAYREYKKKAAAEKHLTALIAEGEAKLDYFESVLDELSRAESERDAALIRRELTDSGLFKPQKGQKDSRPKKIKERGPMVFRSSAGMEILVGRGNAQNDELSTRTARKTDVWLHTQRVHGSHVIIRTGGEIPDEQTVAEAASLAAFFSQARDSGKTPVDYTQIKSVKKPHGSLPGKVVYTDYRTIIAEPDEGLVERLRV